MTGLRCLAAAAAVLVIAACGSSSSDSAGTAAPAADPPPATDAPPPETDAPPDTQAPPTTAAPTTTLPPAIAFGEPGPDGAVPVLIDGAQLAPLFDAFTPGDDPLYLVHTQQDDIFVGVELYTVFGAGWTGELGTFPTDCTTHGICVYLDPDGSGPLEGGGPGEGTITVSQLEGGSILTLDDVTIVASDGQVYTMSGVTLAG